MRKIYLSIGSNKGNRYSFIKEALRLIRKDIGKVILMSKIYETKSWGFQSDDFLNICIMIKSELLPSELLNKLKNIEDKIGRIRDIELNPIDGKIYLLGGNALWELSR